MQLKRPLSLQVVYSTEASRQMQDLGMDDLIDQHLETEEATIYQICSILPRSPEDDTGILETPADTYITTLTYKELKKLIEDYI